MKRLTSLLVGLGGLALGVFCLSIAGTSAQQAPQYPLDDKLAREPAPWTVPGKWGKRGNWGRWGEQDKRGMLNYITPEMIVKAASLVKTGKAYALGEELHGDVARVVRPPRAARRREIQEERSPARRLLDHAGGPAEHREGAERRDPQGRHPAGADGLAQDVGRAGCLRASRCGAHEVASTTTRHRA